MVEVRHVLCPVDFSDFSRRALDHAIAIAKWYGSRLSVLYIYPIPSAGMALSSLPVAPAAEMGMLSPGDREQLRQQLRALAPADALKNVPVAFLVAEGDVAAEILAKAQSADMLVLGTHGRSGFERLVLGSVAEAVVRKAHCPVMTVPRAASDATKAVPILFHHIVAGVDLSDASLYALQYALSLAEEADAHLTVLRVVELPREFAEWAAESEEAKGHVERWKASALSHLRRVIPDEARVYCHVEERVETGQPYRELVRVAAERHAGLIVIGAHGHGVLDRMFLGSTAQYVVRQAVCPVLTIRAPAAQPAATSSPRT
ncbi:MAG: universal stress protein [Acidobacteria bacterium]|nr:universal stress protein [Acidobacteriota bacterium]